MNAPQTAPLTPLELRLRAALAGTHLQAPRPLVMDDLPPNLRQQLPAGTLEQLRPAAVLAPVLRRGAELSLLLTVRASHLRSHSGQIAFPGGGRDAGDADAVANALREAQEEIGLPPQRVEVLGFLDDYPSISRYRVTPVIGLIDGTPPLAIDHGEVAEVFELPLATALDPQAYVLTHLDFQGEPVPMYELHWQQHRIWGLTARMLWNLAQKVSAT